METTTLFFIAYTVGTAFGIWIGFKSGLKKGADVTLDMLMVGKFLLYKKGKDGEIVFIQPENNQEVYENQ